MRLGVYNRATGEVLRTYETAGDETVARGRFVDEHGARTSPIVLGWSRGVHTVVEIVPFVAPDGQRAVGDVSHEWDGARLREVCAVEDIPARGPVDYPLEPFEFHAMVAVLGRDAQIRGAIAGIADRVERTVALARYEQSRLYHRDDALLMQVALAIDMADAEIDAAWMQIVGMRTR